MKLQPTTIFPHPGYEAHTAMLLGSGEEKTSMEELQKSIRAYTLAPGTEMKDIMIPGPEEGQEIRLHFIIPEGLPEKAPMVLDIHGGGFVSGSSEIDNYRCIAIAEHTPCIVASVDYRLAVRERSFMDSLMDCRAAYLWMIEHAAEFGGDPERIGLHGTSAGGNLCACLALYLRDHGEQTPVLNVLNCPAMTPETTRSKLIYGSLGAPGITFYDEVETIYANPDGMPISYYAMPAYCQDLRSLGPHMVVVGEYDPLRDEGLEYALRLLAAKVPCEILCAPRVTHGFCVVDAPLTRWVHEGICASFRREFGMK